MVKVTGVWLDLDGFMLPYTKSCSFSKYLHSGSSFLLAIGWKILMRGWPLSLGTAFEVWCINKWTWMKGGEVEDSRTFPI